MWELFNTGRLSVDDALYPTHVTECSLVYFCIGCTWLVSIMSIRFFSDSFFLLFLFIHRSNETNHSKKLCSLWRLSSPKDRYINEALMGGTLHFMYVVRVCVVRVCVVCGDDDAFWMTAETFRTALHFSARTHSPIYKSTEVMVHTREKNSIGWS